VARKKPVEEVCGNCLLYNHEKRECRVAILVEGKEMHMPVLPKDKCHLEQLNIPIQQVRWWVEDDNGKPTDGKGTVKMEYPKGFFGEERS